MSRVRTAFIGAIVLAGVAAATALVAQVKAPAPSTVDSVAAFAVVDQVLTSPRCQNCHTLTIYPRQGDDRHPHRLNVRRGPQNAGAVGLPCSACHGRANNPDSGVPGANEPWHLAPLAMGWEGRTPSERCAQLKEPARNGKRSGAAIIDHLKTPLVTWAWAPGTDPHGRARTAPPADYARFMQAASAWVEGGAECPMPSR
jgi:hypothetical protein